MNSILVSALAFAFMFGGLFLGLALRARLPEHHFREECRDAVKLGAGLIATLAALVLGLLVSSAKDVYDNVNTGLMEVGAKVTVLDRTLASYGPEAEATRRHLREGLSDVISKIWPAHGHTLESLQAAKISNGLDLFQDEIRKLAPSGELQRQLKTKAQETAGDLALLRLLMIQNAQNVLPLPFLIVLIFWLTMLFMSFGLLTSRNSTVTLALIICALSVSGAIFLILEMNRPLQGLTKLPATALLTAFEQIGGK